ncbi:MAG: STAS/SEC14 domain-containing protein [Burkholderiales bacterium]|nr:STAS/SEC14 domain-containing protein [Burkholderiales bacterium]
MLDYTIMQPEGILVLEPTSRLKKEDFVRLSASVDAYLAEHDDLGGVLIHSESFPGWESLAGLAAHIRFVRDHQQKIQRLALVTNSPVAPVAEALAKYFIAAEIKRFAFADYDQALAWLKLP